MSQNIPENAMISIHDQPVGWASVEGGTTGGGTDLSKSITVDNIDDLNDAIKDNNYKIILVKPGKYDGEINLKSNITIIGIAPGVKISGGIKINGEKNVIIRNLAIRGKEGDSWRDAIRIGDGSHHVWIDHVKVSDGNDGNLDIIDRSDFITISWCKFYYTYEKEHRFSNLISSSDNNTDDRGKLNITYMFCKWGKLVKERQPRGRFGKIHMLNNYHNNDGDIHGVGKEMALIAENSYYNTREDRPIFFSKGEHKGWKGNGNKGTGKKLNDIEGSVFEIPYKYDKVSALKAKEMIQSEYGVGNTKYFVI